ncbi:MAG: thiamine-phosphate kinase, partial [Gemmatimonadota bacterium]|nr:thiamine-phosphate kinase [Gemmatimonadota bacterium]
AEPLGLLAALAIPETWRAHLDAIADGIGEAAASVGAPIIGGDMSRGGELALTITVLGTSRGPLLRTSARAGDRVYVTGRLGGPFKALREFLAGREPEPADRARFAAPFPRIRESIWLGENGATSAIDISDGLSADLSHLAAASRVGIVVDLGKLAIVDGISAVEAAASGEEYELVVTAPVRIDTAGFTEEFGLELSEIGKVEYGAEGVRFLIGDKEIEPPPGYSHFSK